MHAEGCKLEWNPPSDDGGIPVDHYAIEQLDEATGRWVPAGETDGKETNFNVEGLTPGHKYKFRVKAVNRLGQSDPLTAQQAIEAKNPYGEYFLFLQFPGSHEGSSQFKIILKKCENTIYS